MSETCSFSSKVACPERCGLLRFAILPFEGRILQSLNLKNPKAYSLASEISGLTGESLTAAVIGALEQRLESERKKRHSGRTAERILAFAEKFSSHVKPGSHSSDHSDLYDEDGLPK